MNHLLKKRNFPNHGDHRRIGVGSQSFIHVHKEGLMRCYRCEGMMIYEKFYGDCEHFFGWRCIVCGEIIDQVILKNRLEQTH